MSATIVIGLGDAGRAEGGVGPAAIWALRRLDLDEVQLVTWRGEATGLADRWDGVDRVILIDGEVVAGSAGRVRRRSLRHPSTTAGRATGVHGRLVRDALNLSAAFGQLPRTLLMYTVDISANGIVTARVRAGIREVSAEIADVVIGRRPSTKPRCGFVAHHFLSMPTTHTPGDCVPPDSGPAR